MYFVEIINRLSEITGFWCLKVDKKGVIMIRNNISCWNGLIFKNKPFMKTYKKSIWLSSDKVYDSKKWAKVWSGFLGTNCWTCGQTLVLKQPYLVAGYQMIRISFIIHNIIIFFEILWCNDFSYKLFVCQILVNGTS